MSVATLVAAPDMATPLLTFQDFTSLAILLYECGYTEDTVRQEMASASLQVPSLLCHAWSKVVLTGRQVNLQLGSLSLFGMQDLNHEECLLYTCVVWITLMLAPSKTVVRWATKGERAF